MKNYLFTSESVSEGHPDKVCDQISDALLDEYIKGDKKSRCAIETVGGKGKIFITGEVTSNTKVNVEDVVKSVLKDVGYLTDYEIINNIGIQSKDIALGTNDEVLGAGDQGMMFGYACDDNLFYLPTAMVILKELSMEYDKLLKVDNRFKSDGKAQITGYYDEEKDIIVTEKACFKDGQVILNEEGNYIWDESFIDLNDYDDMDTDY